MNVISSPKVNNKNELLTPIANIFSVQTFFTSDYWL